MRIRRRLRENEEPEVGDEYKDSKGRLWLIYSYEDLTREEILHNRAVRRGEKDCPWKFMSWAIMTPLRGGHFVKMALCKRGSDYFFNELTKKQVRFSKKSRQDKPRYPDSGFFRVYQAA